MPVIVLRYFYLMIFRTQGRRYLPLHEERGCEVRLITIAVIFISKNDKICGFGALVKGERFDLK